MSDRVRLPETAEDFDDLSAHRARGNLVAA